MGSEGTRLLVLFPCFTRSWNQASRESTQHMNKLYGSVSIMQLYISLKSLISSGVVCLEMENFRISRKLHLGVNSGAQKFALEHRAVNEATFCCPDELGWQPQSVVLKFPFDVSSNSQLSLRMEELLGKESAVSVSAEILNIIHTYQEVVMHPYMSFCLLHCFVMS
ncbi:hypothetical protein CRYUN_Cryun06bG0122300 [Craigia yunnanensis]